ncbi:MAG: tetratricopeptide repeat protein [Bacteroidia bacterium]|nr:tetratricopeptide repeat protein [Bacteroidia bacterium]
MYFQFFMVNSYKILDKNKLPVFVLISFFLLFSSTISNILAQSHIDSLKSALLKQEDDTNKVNTLIRLSRAFTITEPEKAILYAEKSKRLSRKLDFMKGIGMSYERIGYVHYNHNNFQQGIIYFLKCISIYEKVEDKDIKEQLSSVYNAIGILYYYLADYDKALNYYFKSIKVDEQRGYKQGIASAYNNIGIIYNIQGNYQKALEYYFKSLGINKEVENKGGIATAFNNIGEIYREVGKLDKALEYYFKSLEAHKDERNFDGMSTAYGNVGLVYQNKGELDTALKYHLKGLELQEKTGNKFSLAESYISIGSFYILAKDYNKAKNYYQKALISAEKLGALNIKKDAAEGLSTVYANQKDYITAYRYHVLFKNTSDSIFRKESLQKITQIEMQNEFDRQQEQQELKQKQKELSQIARINRQRIFMYSSLAGFIIMCLLAFFVYRIYLHKQKVYLLLQEHKKQIMEEKAKSENLLLNILPKTIAEELKRNGRATPKQYEIATVMFSDFVGFTRLCEDINPLELINELDYYFSKFDTITEKYDVEKIKTIGDSYMCAGGVPIKNRTHPVDIVLVGLEIQNFMANINSEKRAGGKPEWKLRLGIHTGEVITGVVGTIKFAYDIWGNTVNVASRFEELGEPGKVNISGATYNLIKDYFICTYRGNISAKNKGEIEMYFVERLKPEFSEDMPGIIPNKEMKEILESLKI